MITRTEARSASRVSKHAADAELVDVLKGEEREDVEKQLWNQ